MHLFSNVLHQRCRVNPRRPDFFGGNIYIHTLGVYVQFLKFAPKPQNLQNPKTLPLIQMWRFIQKSLLYLLIVGSHYCVVHFAYALHMRQQNLVPFPCLYIELFGLVIEVIFHYCTTPPCHKINLFKRLFRGSLDDASVLPVSLIFLYPQKSWFLSDDRVNSRMYSVRWSLLITMPSGLRFQNRFS